MEIRQAAAQDVPELARLRCCLFREMEPALDADYDAFYRQLLAYLPDAMARGSLLAVVAVEDGKIVGTAFLTPQERPPKPGNNGAATGYITNMYTLPDHRHKGAGRRMMDALTTLARDHGLRELNLIASGAGLPLYDAMGFYADPKPFMRLHL